MVFLHLCSVSFKHKHKSTNIMKNSAAIYIQQKTQNTQSKVATQSAVDYKEWIISVLCVACLPLIYLIGKFFMSL